jgi:hypothetical protein
MPKQPKAPADVGDVLLDELRAIRWRRRRIVDNKKWLNPPPRCPTPEISPKQKIDHYRRRVHSMGDLSALCLSGGGIRSAAFALGIVQGLAARKLLIHFDYLSTVSGGGYLGSFLTAWAQREGYQRVNSELLNGIQPGATLSPLQHLRRYSNYLTPRAGAASIDTLMVVGLYVRNLLLNWLLLLPILLIAIALVKFFTIAAIAVPSSQTLIGTLTLISIAGIGCAIADSLQQRPGWVDEKSSRSRFLWVQMLPLLISGGSASLAVLKFLQLQGAEKLKTIPLAPFTLLAAGIFLLAAVSVLVFSPQLARRSTRKTIHDLSAVKAICVVLAFVASGAASGYLLGTIFDALYSRDPQNEWLAAFVLICLGPPILILSLSTAELIYVALTSNAAWSDLEREWLARALGYHLRTAIIWTAALALVFGGSYVVWNLYEQSPKQWLSLYTLGGTGGIAGVATALLAKGSSTAATVKKSYDTIKNRSAGFVLAIAMPAFVIILVSFLSAGLDLAFVRHEKYWRSDVSWITLFNLFLFIVALSIFTFLSSLAINSNYFSLHGMYRNRLTRAFLGASNSERAENKFIDMDENDNLALHRIWPNARSPAPPPPENFVPPQLHVINMALNIVATQELAWQERKAMSFTATPRWVGAADLADPDRDAGYKLKQTGGCYRPSESYGGPMTLGTAMTISGAAASPNMGYHSSSPLSVLLTFFNVRLGAWLGNPGPAGAKTFDRHGPRVAALPLVQEALGLTNSNRSYVYLSDGGHFENLGLYEMVRRRCHLIVLSDAGSDPKAGFEDLGNAIRKISIDLNVSIEFKDLKIGPRKDPPTEGPYCAIAKINYPESGAEKGLLLYIKPGFQGLEPPSVRSYAAKNLLFPHEMTSDQWFGESQFEAYRALGYHIMSNIADDKNQPHPDLRTFINSI